MQKIKSANGSIGDEMIYQKSKRLSKKILDICVESKLSYLEQNKALYMADRGLYNIAINRSTKTNNHKNLD